MRNTIRTNVQGRRCDDGFVRPPGTVYYVLLNDAHHRIRDWVFANAASDSLADRLKVLNDLKWSQFTAADRRVVSGWLFAQAGVVRRE